ncbi:MAG: alkaline phosphatase family protein [Emcibacteraceae bacterium]|nr:alkaline phosphatase family protein [Emcibacteraceae bacterium]
MFKLKTQCISLLFIFIFSINQSIAQTKTENVILISLDGVRWQEVFDGIDKRFFDQEKYIKYHNTHENFKETNWHDDPIERRKILFPFLWNTVGKQGQIYGNRALGSNADITNQYYFSYPGYNEILTGIADPRINSNDMVLNPNKTFLEWLDEKAPYAGKTAAFASWYVFPYIINQERSNVFLNSDFNDMVELNDRIKDLNQIQRDTPSPWDSVRLDVFTHEFALEYMKEKKPRALYISYGETDDFAHDGYYDLYINAAKRTDDFIRRIWEQVQSDPHYKDKTTLLITTDHGRGYDTLENWKDHGNNISSIKEVANSRSDQEIWMAVIGPDTPATGEMKNTPPVKQNQIAVTLMKFLGLEYESSHPTLKAGESIDTMFK